MPVHNKGRASVQASASLSKFHFLSKTYNLPQIYLCHCVGINGRCPTYPLNKAGESSLLVKPRQTESFKSCVVCVDLAYPAGAGKKLRLSPFSAEPIAVCCLPTLARKFM